jgi:ABC-type multidrug transport system fused ATPase/permease subunit
MLDKLKSCFKLWTFCRDALAEDFKQKRWYAIMSTTVALAKRDTWYTKLAKWLINLAWGALVPVGLAYWYRAFLLSHKRWVAIVALSVLVMFLVRVIVAVKRFHERTVDGLLLDSNNRMLVIESLGWHIGMIEEHFSSRREMHELPDKGVLEAWLNGAAECIKSRLGHDAFKAFYDGSETGIAVPETAERQLDWIRKYKRKLGIIISELRFPINSDLVITEKEEAELKKVEDSARAWAEKRNAKSHRS